MKYKLPSAILRNFSEFVANRLGLYFPEQKWIDLERAIMEISRLHHFDDPLACIHWIIHSLSIPLQIEILANHLTVGETYFFREMNSFDILKKNILPNLIDERKKLNKSLRIWSAPCSSGEEPYSIAILLTMLIPNINEWNITILASDINEVALQRMREGIYTDWSFRETPTSIKNQYFRKITNNRFEILPKIKKMVTPLYLNLSEDCYPDIANATNAMDLIFCRNMLMYFVPEHREKVIRNFYNTLIDGGHLLVGVSETAVVPQDMFKIINYPGATFYKKSSLDESGQIFHHLEEPDFAMTSIAEINDLQFQCLILEDGKKCDIDLQSVKEIEKAFDSPTEKTVSIEPELIEQQFRELANEGKLNEALEYIDKMIKKGKLNPQLYFYRALLLLELGQDDNAIFDCKNAIYLDPDFVLPYFILGNIARKREKTKEAHQYYATVISLLNHCSNDAILPGSEGLSSQRMKDIIRSILD